MNKTMKIITATIIFIIVVSFFYFIPKIIDEIKVQNKAHKEFTNLTIGDHYSYTNKYNSFSYLTQKTERNTVIRMRLRYITVRNSDSTVVAIYVGTNY